MFKVIVVDDHPFIRACVTALVEQQKGHVVAQTNDGVQAVQLARLHRPDLMILDVSLPMLDGLDVMARVTALGVPCKFLVLTAQPAALYSQRCLQAGASGFILKTNDLEDMSKALNAVMNGYSFFPDTRLDAACTKGSAMPDEKLIASLSDRELAILQQLAHGKSNKQIGDAMLLSNKTISTYKVRLIKKLSAPSVLYLADFARRNHLV